MLLMVPCCCSEDNNESEETTKPGLPVPTAEIVEAVQHVLGLKPPPRLAGAVQKLLNCCPEAQAAMQAQVGASMHDMPVSVHALAAACFGGL